MPGPGRDGGLCLTHPGLRGQEPVVSHAHLLPGLGAFTATCACLTGLTPATAGAFFKGLPVPSSRTSRPPGQLPMTAALPR